MKEANLRNDLDEALIIIEGMLQHYGIETRCIDAVDSHWIALWFGLNKYHSERVGNSVYSSYTNRIKNVYQMFGNERKTDDKESCYQYVILMRKNLDTIVGKRTEFHHRFNTTDIQNISPSVSVFRTPL